jgi:hypothetical protein
MARGLSGSGGRRWRGASVAALAVLWAVLPSPARASDPSLVTGVAESTVCQVSLSLVFNAPVSLLSASPPPAENIYNLSGSGTCYGTSTSVLALRGTGATAGMPSCAAMVSAFGTGTMNIGAAAYAVTFDLVGPTAAPHLVIPYTLFGVSGNAELLITAASLQACAQAGGTTSLQYTGALVVGM